ncbi:hypothetical protein ANRL1_00698 [Anaerolineae bacterium]|nr:hypothetical protein ANRL1_00698 [Anaerolineae bacterium]
MFRQGCFHHNDYNSLRITQDSGPNKRRSPDAVPSLDTPDVGANEVTKEGNNE